MNSGALDDAAKVAFARHETFHPRYGWLRKGFIGASLGGDSFSQPTAPVVLGVGKNMVHAIRYWGLAFKVLKETPDPNRPRLPQTVVSPFGAALLSDDGWDPYLEDPASLWLLHWMLLRPKCLIPSWWTAFNLFDRQVFEEEVLTGYIADAVAAVPDWPDIVTASIKKDVNCLIRTYAPRRFGRAGLDDVIDSPFREMHLIESVADDSQSYRFAHGHKKDLHPDIVGFAALDFAARRESGARSITLSSLTREPSSPGLVFKLSEEALHDALARFAGNVPDVHLAEPAGLRQLMFDDNPGDLAPRALARHYRDTTGSRRTASLPLFDLAVAGGAAP